MTHHRLVGTLLVLGAMVASRPALADEDPTPRVSRAALTARAIETFTTTNPGARLHFAEDGRIGRVYGKAFAHGVSPLDAAHQFVRHHAALFGVEPDDLAPLGPFPDQRHVVPILFDRETGRFRFTGVFFTQHVDGIPVYGGQMRLLVRNDPGAPVVLAATDLRALDGFDPWSDPRPVVDVDAALAAGIERLGAGASFSDPQLVVWAGVDQHAEPARLALQYTGQRRHPDHQAWRYLVDARDGTMLYAENVLHHADVTGTVRAEVTDGIGMDVCHGIATVPLPYARVEHGDAVVFADQDGTYVLTAEAGAPVQVRSTVAGRYFTVYNDAGLEAQLVQSVTAPAMVDLTHNAGNAFEFRRAEVNAYRFANDVRDIALSFNPAYPEVAEQEDFTVNVNIDASCNAFYNPIDVTINFFKSTGDCPNTACETIVYHEYGHHLIQVAGSGQGQYGEGMSDSVAIVITDDPRVAPGWRYDCAVGLRTAENDVMYPCVGFIHACGRLLSGSIWETRNALALSEPMAYRDIIAGLTINSILLHTGSLITPQITIDFLTLDDDDDNILNGTPHYAEINAGFGAHNMPAPPLDPLDISFPAGRPELLTPDVATDLVVRIDSVTEDPDPGTAQFQYCIGSDVITVPLSPIGGAEYLATIPAQPCGTAVGYSVSVSTIDGAVMHAPPGAPSALFTAVAARTVEVVFADDGEEDLGWTVENDASLTDGVWERGEPAGAGDRGDPTTDADGSGQCFLTANAPGNSDVDGGATALVSPSIDLAGSAAAVVSYWRWYSNVEGGTPFEDVLQVEVQSGEGAAWSSLEQVGPDGDEVRGGWLRRERPLAHAGAPIEDLVRLRFTASDLGESSIVEAAVDGVQIHGYGCDAACPWDLSGDGSVGADDLAVLLDSWGLTDVPADFDGGGVGAGDLAALLDRWGPCP